MDEPMEEPTSSAPQQTQERLAKIRVKTLHERIIEININLDRPLSVLRHIISETLGTDANRQRIIFQGKVMPDDTKLLKDYGLTDGQTVHVVDRPLEIPADRPYNQPEGLRNRILPPQHQARNVIPVDFHGLEGLRNLGIGNLLPNVNNRTVTQLPEVPLDVVSVNGPVIIWRVAIEQNGSIHRESEALLRVARTAIDSITYLPRGRRADFDVHWTSSGLRIDFPLMSAHIASPALERLSYVESQLHHLQQFREIVEEPDGLMDLLRQICRWEDRQQDHADVTQRQLESRIRGIAARLERPPNMQNGSLTPSLQRLRESTDAEREARMQYVPPSGRNRACIMRHPIEKDLYDVSRRIRQEQIRFFALEEFLENLVQSPAYQRIQHSRMIPDFRLNAFTVFREHLSRRRHMIGHMYHTLSELDVPNGVGPQRLLPQYDLRQLDVPVVHRGAIIFTLQSLPRRPEVTTERISTVFTPPRRNVDVGNFLPGEWPYLTYYPTDISGIMQEQHELAIPVVNITLNNQEGQQEGVPNEIAAAILPLLQHAAPLNVGSAPSPTTAPPTQPVTVTPRLIARGIERIAPILSRNTREVEQPRLRPAGPERSSMHDRPGPETESLSALPEAITVTDIQRVARVVGSRYRQSALKRVARRVTAAFREENPAWNIPLEDTHPTILRQLFILTLELFTLTSTTVREASYMMSQLVDNEDLLVRRLTEAMRQVFREGIWPPELEPVVPPPEDNAEEPAQDHAEGPSRPPPTSSANATISFPEREQGPSASATFSEAPAREPLPRHIMARLFRETERNILPSWFSVHRAVLPNVLDAHRVLTSRGSNDFETRERRGDSVTVSATNQEPTTETTDPFSPGQERTVEASIRQVHRQTIAIDPYLSCHNRHSEIERMQNGGLTEEMSRFTEESRDPAAPYEALIDGTEIPERESETASVDPDYSYDVQVQANGALVFAEGNEGLAQFERVLRTAMRSLFAHVVDTDAIRTLNSAASEERFIHRDSRPQRRRHFATSQQPPTSNNQETPNNAGGTRPTVSADISPGFDGTGITERSRSTSPEPLIVPESTFHDVARFISGSRDLGFPPTLIGEIYETLSLREDMSTDLRRLLSRPTAEGNIERDSLVVEMREAMRDRLILNELDGITVPSSDDLLASSLRLAIPERYVEDVLEIAGAPRSIFVDGEEFRVSTITRNVEVETLRVILDALFANLNDEEYLRTVSDAFRMYVRNMVGLIFLMTGRQAGEMVPLIQRLIISFSAFMNDYQSDTMFDNMGQQHFHAANYISTFFDPTTIHELNNYLGPQLAMPQPTVQPAAEEAPATPPVATESRGEGSSRERDEGETRAKRMRRSSGASPDDGEAKEMDISKEVHDRLSVFDEQDRQTIAADIERMSSEPATYRNNSDIVQLGVPPEFRGSQSTLDLNRVVSDAVRSTGAHVSESQTSEMLPAAEEAGQEMFRASVRERLDSDEDFQDASDRFPDLRDL